MYVHGNPIMYKDPTGHDYFGTDWNDDDGWSSGPIDGATLKHRSSEMGKAVFDTAKDIGKGAVHTARMMNDPIYAIKSNIATAKAIKGQVDKISKQGIKNYVKGNLQAAKGKIDKRPAYYSAKIVIGLFTGYATKQFGLGGPKIGKKSILWPPKDGFVSSRASKLKPGKIIDRYSEFVGVNDTGRFAANKGTSFGKRSLPDNYKDFPLTKYKVLKTINVKAGKAAPWFGQSGGGMQYRLPKGMLCKKLAVTFRKWWYAI